VANPKEKLLWSIALPGFGQFLNGKLIKGVVFVFLEFLINVQSNFNKVIISSSHGEIGAYSFNSIFFALAFAGLLASISPPSNQAYILFPFLKSLTSS
jgi:hypothetical protein